jgi:nitrite reductase/ring-hydroxylating ferredoxin subunit
MQITRRQFTAAAGSVFALTVLGCNDEAEPESQSGGRKRGKLKLPDSPFWVGAADKYRQADIYQTYRESHGVWLVSDGTQLVALSAVCTHNYCGTGYDPDAQLFVCPCHSSTYTTDGVNQPGGKTKRPLERCKIELLRKPDSAAMQVRVDPTIRFRRGIDDPIAGHNWSVLLFSESDS